MNKCPKCFAPIEVATNFCTHCGYSPEYAPPSSVVIEASATNTRDGGTGGQTPNRELMKQAWDSLRGKWDIAFGTFFLYVVVSFAGSLVPIVGMAAPLIIPGPLMVGLSKFFLIISRSDERPQVEILFKGFNQFGPALGAYLLLYLVIFVGMIFLFIPAIIFGYGFYLIFFILADNPDMGPIDAYSKSWNMMSGYKWKMFCLHCRFIGWGLLCIVTFGLATFFVAPYMMVATAKFYDDLSH